MLVYYSRYEINCFSPDLILNNIEIIWYMKLSHRKVEERKESIKEKKETMGKKEEKRKQE